MVESIKTAVQSFAIWLVGLVGLSKTFADYVYLLFISVLPIIELRGALLVAPFLDVTPFLSFIVSVIGNLLPIPFILILIRKVCEWMKKVSFLKKIPIFLEQKVEKHKDKVTKYGKWGLFLFVAIPLPGTGAWTGALIASFLNFKFRDSMFAIVGGVITAGIIMTAVSFGLLGLIF